MPTVDAALLQMPQFQPGSGGFTNQSGGGLGVGQATLNLRGLQPVRTLVLLDGRRLQPGNSQNVIDTNIEGLVALTRALLPTLVERKGAVINLSSVAATYPYKGGAVYAGSKAFVRQFSLGLRGRILAAGEGSLQMEVDRVRHYPGGRWLDIDTRVVELVVPANADVSGLGDTAGLRRVLNAPISATAFTLRSKTTADAILGVPGSLKASRVVRISG